MLAATQEEILVPIKTEKGGHAFFSVDLKAAPSYLVVVRRSRAHLLETAIPGDDRLLVSALTLSDAIGKVLMANPKLCYADIIAHMEV